MDIQTLHMNKTGKVSDKWGSYLTYYDTLLKPFQSQTIKLLEIGIQNGGSLETWAQYFENGVLFVGCDINPLCANLTYSDPRIKVIVGNANSDQCFSAVKKHSSNYNLIIDDGSHLSPDVFLSFIHYFDLVTPGGIYIIEDAHALYGNRHLGGIMNATSAHNFFHLLADITNHQFWRDDLSIQLYLQTFFPDGNVPKILLDGWLESVEFRNSIITIRKSLVATHEKLGQRLVKGTIAEVHPNILRHQDNQND